MLYILIVNLIISSFYFVNSFATTPEELIESYNKTPPLINYYPYGDFSFEDKKIKWSTFNNLRRKTGSAFYALGEPLFVEGYIKDVNGVPIDGVSIRMIQANSNGVYNNMSEKTDGLYDENFAGNGITVTDNRGYYRFLTVFPGYYNKRAPHLHMLIEHPKYGRIETEVFFQHHPRNANDYKYKKLSIEQRKIATAEVLFLDPSDKEAGKKAIFNVMFNVMQPTKEI